MFAICGWPMLLAMMPCDGPLWRRGFALEVSFRTAVGTSINDRDRKNGKHYQNHTVEPLGGLSKSALSQRELQHWPTNLSRRTK